MVRLANINKYKIATLFNNNQMSDQNFKRMNISNYTNVFVGISALKI